jgi:hypothetical protein
MVLVEVKRKFDTKVCRVSLDGVPLQFEDDVATRNLPAGEHAMTWHVVGNQGQKYEIMVTKPKGIECHPKETLDGGMSFGACPIDL